MHGGVKLKAVEAALPAQAVGVENASGSGLDIKQIWAVLLRRWRKQRSDAVAERPEESA